MFLVMNISNVQYNFNNAPQICMYHESSMILAIDSAIHQHLTTQKHYFFYLFRIVEEAE
jgi:hypothetical protein